MAGHEQHNETSDEEESSDDEDLLVTKGTGDPTRTSDAKDEAAKEKKMVALKGTLWSAVNCCIKNPEKYRSADLFAPLRYLHTFATAHPHDFPVRVTTSTAATESDTTATIALTSGFASKISSEWYQPSSTDTPPVLKIVERDMKYRPQHVENKKSHVPITTLTAVDGNTMPVLVKVASQLNNRIGDIQVGCIIKVLSFQTIYFLMSSAGDSRVALLMLNYEIIGSSPPTKEESLAYKSRVVVSVSAADDEEEDEVVEDDRDDDHSRRKAGAIEKHFASAPKAAKCTRQNRLCSLYGVDFESSCVCDAFPVHSHIFEDIAQQCWFVNVPLSSMTDRHKRCVYYWWYATNIYLICGKGNRAELPDCLVDKIRQLIPSPTGKHVGYKKHSKKKSNTRTRSSSTSSNKKRKVHKQD
mmetsp:Transcript_13058/g.28304  ORF Transcript_13058/g.28304 Transcript_13058/m.28304 type:complete len:413 (+) Transcript_13058:199-1437(+)|eukprot:CAMPEP_0178516720 /NCGR_PEP_ID=MMETSP0696-20121128/25277_1 /TAXON_ID=265572 /ORGANISM="Extubocellulus spinifer, Strain CCMP396" /LENGTH=412 /DNA_ID=CAMNT_0020147041 /DNA_START=139 /DNA_END=1377 /DNA_ORIENTATION=-